MKFIPPFSICPISVSCSITTKSPSSISRFVISIYYIEMRLCLSVAYCLNDCVIEIIEIFRKKIDQKLYQCLQNTKKESTEI